MREHVQHPPVREAHGTDRDQDGAVHVPRFRRLRVARMRAANAFVWRLRRAMPPDFFREAKVAAG